MEKKNDANKLGNFAAMIDLKDILRCRDIIVIINMFQIYDTSYFAVTRDTSPLPFFQFFFF